MTPLNHPLDLGSNGAPEVLDLFAEEVAPVENLNMCCGGATLGTYTTLYTWGGSCASTFSTASTLSCECCGS